MVRKRKSDGVNEPMVGEGAVTYEPRSVAHVFWLAFKSLSSQEQSAFLERLLNDPEFYEEIADAVAMIEARDEPTRPYKEFKEELLREGLL